MCGIFGILNNINLSAKKILKVSNLLKHRGPDDEGVMIYRDKINFYIGKDTIDCYNKYPLLNTIQEIKADSLLLLHRRLSIIDLTEAGHQPFADNSGNFVIVFNGEVYNYIEIRNELMQKGYNFRSGTDTEVILNSYIEWGSECVNKFVGMWAFAIFDKTKEILFLSRDRFGIKPLYYKECDNYFVFCSEIKPILEIENWKTDINNSELFEYISYGYIEDFNQTLFKDIKILKKGSNLFYNLGNKKLSCEKYYDLNDKIIDLKSNDNKIFEKWNSLFTDSIKIHLRSDIEVGACLSGGLDSSTITGYSSKQTGITFKTFTASYKGEDIDESKYVIAISNYIKNIKTEFVFPNSADMMKEFGKMIYHQELPILSSSVYAQWKVMQLASQNNVKVLLDGQGADEVLGGYAIFSGFYLMDLLKKGYLFKFIKNIKNISKVSNRNLFNEVSRAIYYQIPKSIQRVIRKQNKFGNQLISQEFYNDTKKDITHNERIVSYNNLTFHSINYGMSELLRYEDKNSMAFSIESRVPFLDHRLVEYSVSLPSEYKYRDGYSKYILRETAAKVLPKEIAWRKDKLGFVTPQKKWKKEVKMDLIEMLQGMKCPDLIDKNVIIKAVYNDNFETKYISDFWKAISILVWYNLFFKNS